MTKQFSLVQLFSLVDGRLSTSIGDVYEMLNHVCDDSLFTHHLPVAHDYLQLKRPKWLIDANEQLLLMDIDKSTDFKVAMKILSANNKMYDVPQLKDEFDTSDYEAYMLDNSLLIKRFSKQSL